MNKYVLKAYHIGGYFSWRMEIGFLSDFYCFKHLFIRPISASSDF